MYRIWYYYWFLRCFLTIVIPIFKIHLKHCSCKKYQNYNIMLLYLCIIICYYDHSRFFFFVSSGLDVRSFALGPAKFRKGFARGKKATRRSTHSFPGFHGIVSPTSKQQGDVWLNEIRSFGVWNAISNEKKTIIFVRGSCPTTVFASERGEIKETLSKTAKDLVRVFLYITRIFA